MRKNVIFAAGAIILLSSCASTNNVECYSFGGGKSNKGLKVRPALVSFEDQIAQAQMACEEAMFSRKKMDKKTGLHRIKTIKRRK